MVDSDSDESYQESAEPEDSPDEELYVVEKILDVRIRKGVSHCRFDISCTRAHLFAATTIQGQVGRLFHG